MTGHIPFGTDAGLPKTFVKEINISYQGQSYLLDASDMCNAWGKRPLEVKGSVRYFGGRCFDGKNCEFRGLFSDGAGTFVAEWRIVNGTPVRTVLTSSNDVVNLFILKPREINSNCTYSRYPCSILDSLKISVRGKEIDVPRSVFFDLADLRKGLVRRVGQKYLLTLGGGDAAESYIVEVQFDRTGIALFL